jgi:hypothetical protein
MTDAVHVEGIQTDLSGHLEGLLALIGSFNDVKSLNHDSTVVINVESRFKMIFLGLVVFGPIRVATANDETIAVGVCGMGD